MSARVAAALARDGLDWIVPRWEGPPNVAAFFTTRHDAHGGDAFDVGPSHPPADALAGAIGAHRRYLRARVPGDPVWLAQVHGCTVAAVDAGNAAALAQSPPQADAAVTRTPGVVLTVRTADCLPVLFADRAGSVLAVAHAGWRGLAGGVLEATLAAMAVAPATVAAWLGPAIGPRAFEVGADVRDAFVGADPPAAVHFVPKSAGKWWADLPALARRRLGAAGVVAIAQDDGCTVSDAARFHSHRRDRARERMALVAWLADDATAR